MATSSNHALVALWFSQRMAVGDLARDHAAHAQAVAARDDLVKRLDASAGASAKADAVNAWFDKAIKTGAIARNTVAYNQAFAAKGDLIARLAAASPAANVIRPSAPVIPAKAGAKAAQAKRAPAKPAPDPSAEAPAVAKTPA